ncbi:hypothetical protein HAD_05320 [Hyphomonas adhaerens MHS-3]|uniref:Uncharacterized protein n=1 Tax=Hyphomonas adhaerens MHS-3 TaxID=1280949 RepID=A0A069E4A2_9PROT|nr:hypothetical protein [Hyphomonas adhaerens]KCZ85075.1 hypothetical protein HAD_05320 [Hyphomonas adhaerens MHS-3]
MTKRNKSQSSDEIIELMLQKARILDGLEDGEAEDEPAPFLLEGYRFDQDFESAIDTALEQCGISRTEFDKHFDDPVVDDCADGQSGVGPQRIAQKFGQNLAGFSDWVNATLNNLGGAFGRPVYAMASSGRATRRRSASRSNNVSSVDRIWMQGDVKLSLHSSGKRELKVTLLVEGDVHGKPTRLCWLDESSFSAGPEDPLTLITFPIDCQDDGTYRVIIPAGIYSKRMQLIAASEERDDVEETYVRLLLPFLETEQVLSE